MPSSQLFEFWKFLGKIAIVIGSVIFLTCSAELVLRAANYGEANRSHFEKFMEYDPLLGWRHKRNFAGQLNTKDYSIEVAYNSHGLRGKAWSYTKAQGAYRILVLGGSFADGYSVKAEDQMTDVLEASLGPTFEVINLGVAGYSTDQDLLQLETEGWNYQSDLVILLFSYRDVWANGRRDMMGRTEKPVFRLDAAGNPTLTNVPVPYPKPALPDRFKVFALIRTAIRGNTTLNWLATKTGLLHNYMAKVPSIAPPGAAGLMDEFVVYQETETPELERRWAITHALLDRIKQRTAQRGARFIVSYVPMLVELSTEEWNNSHIPSGYNPSEVAQRLIRICKEEGIPYSDPSDRFREALKKGSLYFPHDAHWNAAGHHLAAQILAEQVRAIGLLQAQK